MATKMSNFAYLEDFLQLKASQDPQYFTKCLDRMRAYEDAGDKWWLQYSNNCVELAARQIQEDVLLIPFRTFVQGISEVLNRPVKNSEVSKFNKALIAEFDEKYRKMNN